MSIIYRQQQVFCAEPDCHPCHEGIGHGTYWSAHQTKHGQTARTSIGKHLPSGASATQDQAPLLRLYTLGPLRVEQWVTTPQGQKRWQPLPDREAFRLLGFLASCPERKATITQLCGWFWPGAEDRVARGMLERTLAELFHALDAAHTPLLFSQERAVVLEEQHAAWVDADAFEDLLALAQQTADQQEKESFFAQAGTLYRGEFLAKEQMEPVSARRGVLRKKWSAMQLELADLALAGGRWQSTIEELNALLLRDATNEAVVQRLMRAFAHTMRRSEAMHLYQHTASLLRSHGALPTEATRSLYESICRGETEFQQQRRDTPSPPHALQQALPPSLGRPAQSPLVGRDQEHSRLQRQLLEQVDNHFEHPIRTVFLSGEAGIGKTRLAEEIGRLALASGWHVAWATAYAQEQALPYSLWVQVLRQAFAQCPLTEKDLVDHADKVALLQALLPEALPPDSPARTLKPDPIHEQALLWEAISTLLTLLSQRVPLLLVLDDLHWADTQSAAFLAYLCRKLATSKHTSLRIMGTCRDTDLAQAQELSTTLRALQRERALEVLTIAPLSPEDIQELVLNTSPWLPEQMMDHISAHAGGNPFFAEELTRALPSPLSSPSTGKLPSTIAAVLDQRLLLLSERCRQLLAQASVFGGPIQFQAISAMTGATADEHEDLLTVLEEATEAKLLREEASGAHIVYHFWHPLLASHLYTRLSAVRRLHYHRRAAESLQLLYQNHEEEGAAIIAEHLRRGGADPREIARYDALAGHYAYQLFAYAEAARHYRNVIQYFDSPEAQSDQDQEIPWVLIGLGECLRIQGLHLEARSVYQRALEAWDHQADVLPAEDIQAEEAQIRALLWSEIGLTWYDVGDQQQALSCYAQGEQVLQEANVTEGPAWARLRYERGYVHWYAGEYLEAKHYAQEALRLFEQHHQAGGQFFPFPPHLRLAQTLVGDAVDLARTSQLLGTIAGATGQLEEARHHLQDAIAIFEHHHRTRELAIACCNLGNLLLQCSEYEQAHAILSQCLRLAEQIGELPLVVFATGNLGILHKQLGRLDDAEQLFKQAVLAAEQSRSSAASLWFAHYALLLLDQGQLDTAHTAVQHALKQAHSSQLPPYLGMALLALARLRLVQARDMATHERKLQTLARARRTLARALSLPGIEAETKLESQLLHAHIIYAAQEGDWGQQQASQVQHEAQDQQHLGIEAQATRLLGAIAAAKGHVKHASTAFQQAEDTFLRSGMRLEYARTVYQRYLSLFPLERESALPTEELQRARASLLEVLEIFEDCHATRDAQHVKHLLTTLQ